MPTALAVATNRCLPAPCSPPAASAFRAAPMGELAGWVDAAVCTQNFGGPQWSCCFLTALLCWRPCSLPWEPGMQSQCCCSLLPFSPLQRGLCSLPLPPSFPLCRGDASFDLTSGMHFFCAWRDPGLLSSVQAFDGGSGGQVGQGGARLLTLQKELWSHFPHARARRFLPPCPRQHLPCCHRPSWQMRPSSSRMWCPPTTASPRGELERCILVSGTAALARLA